MNPLVVDKHGDIIQMRVSIERGESKFVLGIKKLAPGTVTRHPTSLHGMLWREIEGAPHCHGNWAARRDNRNV